MGYRSRTDHMQGASDIWYVQHRVFLWRGGGRFTLMEDILKVNARLIPSIYFLVVYTRTKKPQRSKRSPQPGYFYMCLKDRSNSSLLKQKTPGIFNWKTSMYNRIPRAANSGFLPSRRISLPWSVTSFKSTK